MNYEEFSKYKEVTNNKFVKKFADGKNFFYIEPAFYTQLLGIKERLPEEFNKVIKTMEEIVQENKFVAFVYDFETPFLDYKECVLRELVDVTDKCKVFVEDKSRGSDYGD